MAKRTTKQTTSWFTKLLMGFGKAKTAPVKGSGAEKQDHKHLVDLELKQLMEADPDSSIHIVSLREYSQATGANWLVLRPKVMLLAETIINRLLAQGATIMPREDFFLVVFKRQSPAKNKQQILEVCIELGQRLVGANFKMTGSGLSPAIGFSEIQAKALQDSNAIVVMTALETAVWQAQSLRQNMAVPEMSLVEASAVQENEWVSMDTKSPATASNWETMKRDRNNNDIKMVEMKTETMRPSLVLGQANRKQVAWN